MSDNQVITLMLSIRDARKIAQALVQNITTAKLIAEDQEARDALFPFIRQDQGLFAEILEEGNKAADKFSDLYYEAVAKIADNPFDDTLRLFTAVKA